MILRLLPLFLIAFLFISATTVKVEPKVEVNATMVSAELPSVATFVKKSKLNFVEKLVLKYVLKKLQKADDPAKADKLAKTSFAFGIAAVALLLIGFFVPYVILGAIPAGIVAMATGGSALKSGTTETAKARTGKSLGLASLIAIGALFILALAIVASWSGWG